MHYSSRMGGLQPASPLWNLPNRLETYCQTTLLSLKWVSIKARGYVGWSERTQGPPVCGVYWLPVFALCKNSMKTLAPALSAGVWSYQAALSSTLGCIALSSILSLPNTHTQRMRGDSLPFCPEWSFLSRYICNMVSLRSSPTFRLTSLKTIITHSHDRGKNKQKKIVVI